MTGWETASCCLIGSRLASASDSPSAFDWLSATDSVFEFVTGSATVSAFGSLSGTD